MNIDNWRNKEKIQGEEEEQRGEMGGKGERLNANNCRKGEKIQGEEVEQREKGR